MTAKLAKIVLSIIVGMLGLVLVMVVLAGAGPVAARDDAGQSGGSTLLAGVPSHVEVNASPTEIRADGDSNSTITGTVYDEWNQPVGDAFIAFTTTLGTIAPYCYAEAEGASVNRSSGDWTTVSDPGASGGQYVKTSGTVSPDATLSWTFTATAISLLYVSDSSTGGVAEVQVDDRAPVTVAMCSGTMMAAERVIAAGLSSEEPHTITVTQLLSPPECPGGPWIRVDAFRCGTTTDDNGEATATLTSTVLSCGSQDATVIALTGDPSILHMITYTEPVTFTASVPGSVEVTAAPNPIVANGISTTLLTAVVEDQFVGEYMPNCTMVGFVATDENGAPSSGTWITLPYELVEGEDPTEVITDGWSIRSNGHHGGEAIYSNTPGATASWDFTGTAVSLIYPKLSDAGVATVTVDSGAPITIDMYASSDRFQIEHVITSCLDYSPHVITVTVAGYTGTVGATDKRVYVDAFRSGASTSGDTATAIATSGTQAGVVWAEATAVGRPCCETDSVVTDTMPITLTAGNPHTLTITPADIPIECCVTSTLQFTVTDQYSNVVGVVVPRTLTVDFTSTPDGDFSDPSVVVTDGVGSVIFHGWTVGTGAITGTVRGHGVTDTSNLSVAAASCQTLTVSADPTQIYVTDTNTALLTNFIYTSTVTAELRDKCNNPVQDGTVVTFTTSLGSLSTATQTTTSGLATAVLTSEQISGVPTRTAYITVTGAGCPVSDTTTVDFGLHVYTLTVAADPDEIRVDGKTSDLTADVKDGFGNSALNGVRVVFTTTPTARAWVLPGYVETESGKAITMATSATQTGLVTITAVAGSTVTNTTLITITAGNPHTLTITPADISITCCMTSTLQFTVTDQFTNVVGAVVSRPLTMQFTVSHGSLIEFTPASEFVITDGIGSVGVHGWTSGTGYVQGSPGFDVWTTSALTVSAGEPVTLTVTRAPAIIQANDTDTAIITATVQDACENLLCNRVVTFTTDFGSFETSTETPSITATTSCPGGAATAMLRSWETKSGRATITVTVDDTLTKTTYVDMVGAVFNVELEANPTIIQVGGDTSTLTATVKDVLLNPVADGTVVTFTTSLGILGSTWVTDTTTGGTATAVLTAETTAGTAVITATSASADPATTTVTIEAGSPATMTLEADPESISVGGFTSTLTVTVTDQYNNPVGPKEVTLTTTLGSLGSDTITKTTADGVATAVLTSTVTEVGTAFVTATVGSGVDMVTGTTTVTFTAGPAYTVTLEANPASLTVDASSSLTATVKDEHGNLVAPTMVTFTTSLGSLSSDTVTTTNGIATATLTSQEDGTATVTATIGMTSAVKTVVFNVGLPYTVTLVAHSTTLTAGGTSTLTATVTDQYENLVGPTVVTFTTSLGSLGNDPVTRTTTSGVATATLTSQVAGTAAVTATADSKYDTTDVTFQPDLPYTLTLVADPTTLAVGGSSTLTVTVTDQYSNNVADETMVTFETSLGSLGSTTIDKPTTDGVAVATLTSLLPGTAAITATAGSASDNETVIFNAGSPYTVTLEANPTSILVGGFTSTLTVTVVDQYDNNVADDTEVLFETSLGSLGSVTVTKFTADGVATAILTSGETVGTAMITATAGSEVATTVVTFTPDVPDVMTLVADPTSLTVGETSMLTATVKDQYENDVADGTVVTFTTSLGEVGSTEITKTTTSGVTTAELTSQVPGTATVAATADPVSDTVDVTFEVGPAYTVTLEAYPMTLTVGSSSALTATVTDQYNNSVADGTVVTFTTSLGDVGSQLVTKTTTSGVAIATLTSQVAGTAAVTATADSKYDTTNVIFQPALPYTLTLVAYPMALTVVDTSTLTATVQDQYENNVADGTVVTFTTSLGEVGSESVTKTTTSGVATAELSSQVPGTATVTATADPVSDTVDVTFEVGPPYTVTLVAYPTSLTVGATSTLTVTVSDQFNNNVADGTVVNFETNLGSLGSTTVSKTTVSGVATATLTSQIAGTAVVTATSDSKYGTANVTFDPDLPYTMTVKAYPTSIPIGGFTSEITATVKDQYDNPVADGTEVTIATDLGSVGSSSVVKTTVNGVANATLTSDLIIGTANITAASGSAEGQTQVIFTVGAPYTITVESWPPTIEVGGSTATITATVTDIGGYPVADDTPVVFTTDFASLGSSTVTKYTTDGVAVATLTSGTTPGVAHITATADSKFDTATVKVAAGPPFSIDVTADPTYIPIGGATSLIMATVKDRYGNNVTNGTNVDFITTLGSVSPSSDVTDEGTAVTTLTSGIIEGPATVTAIAGPEDGSVEVIFTVGPPFYISVVADPANIALNGHTSNIQATVKDIGGNNVADGTEVTFVTSLGLLGSDTVIKTTTSGVAEAVLTSETTAGTAIITATADSHYHTTEVVFSPDPPRNVTVTADPMAIPANGVSTSTVRAAVTDQYGNMVADGITCHFHTTLGGVWPPFDTTLNGVAETTLTSSETTGLAAVTATCEDIPDTIYVSFYVPVFKVYLPTIFKAY